MRHKVKLRSPELPLYIPSTIQCTPTAARAN